MRPLVRSWLATCALLAAAPTPAAVVINEIHYNSPGSPDVEFVELLNDGPAAVDLTGWTLLDQNDENPPCPLSGLLAPGKLLVVTNRLDLFPSVFPGVTDLNPVGCDDAAGNGFGWGNSADSVRLFDALGALVDAVAYEDGAPWPLEADGEGASLELINPTLDRSDPASWAAGFPPTPGAVNGAFVADLAPSVRDVERVPSLPTAGVPVAIHARVGDDAATPGSLVVQLRVQVDGAFETLPMADDGNPPDEDALDGVWSRSIPPVASGVVVRYWIRAIDPAGNEGAAPPGAPTDRFGYTADYVPPLLRITEIMADNASTAFDPSFEADDWIEIANLGATPAGLGGRFLSNDPQRPERWALPDVTLPPGEHVLFWADAQPQQGIDHGPFRLAAAGGELTLSDPPELGGMPVDSFTFGPQNEDISYGLAPIDAGGREYLANPTPGYPNDPTPYSAICINEIQAGSQVGAADWIELYHRGAAPIDLGGWGLTDDPSEPRRYVFPDGTVLAGTGRLSLDAATLGFGLSASGTDALLLTSPNRARDYLDFGAQFDDVSLARVEDGEPRWMFLAPPTRDAPNVCSDFLPPLPGVTGLRFDGDGVARWETVEGIQRYDVVTGRLDRTGGLTPRDVACLFDDLPATEILDATIPAPRELRFLLVRAVDQACRRGPWAVEPTADDAVATAPGACF